METEKPDFSSMLTAEQVRAFAAQLESYPWEKCPVIEGQEKIADYLKRIRDYKARMNE